MNRAAVKYELVKALTILRYGGLSNYPLLRSVPAELRNEVSKRICYSRAHNFCYVRVPKAANSTITKTLADHMGLSARLPDDPRGEKAKKAMRGLPTETQFDAAYSFTFVREPRSRILSAWSDKGSNPEWIARYGMGSKDDPAKPAPFLDWLRMLEDGLLMKNPHWAPQASILPYKGQRFDFVGRVETLDADLETVIGKIFGSYHGTTNREVRRTHAQSRVQTDIGDEERSIIFRLYEEDYDLFYTDMKA